MKKIILVITLTLSLFGLNKPIGHIENVTIDKNLVSAYKYQLSNLSPQQVTWLSYVYRVCSKYDLQNTCVAIAWEESQFNLYGVIPDTGDYGLMGINLYWFMKDNGYNTRNRYKRMKWATKLVKDDEYNIMYSIVKLQKLQKQYGNNWYKIWAHYNGGTYPNYIYAKRILNKIYVFRRWLNRQTSH